MERCAEFTLQDAQKSTHKELVAAAESPYMNRVRPAGRRPKLMMSSE